MRPVLFLPIMSAVCTGFLMACSNSANASTCLDNPASATTMPNPDANPLCDYRKAWESKWLDSWLAVAVMFPMKPAYDKACYTVSYVRSTEEDGRSASLIFVGLHGKPGTPPAECQNLTRCIGNEEPCKAPLATRKVAESVSAKLSAIPVQTRGQLLDRVSAIVVTDGFKSGFSIDPATFKLIELKEGQ